MPGIVVDRSAGSFALEKETFFVQLGCGFLGLEALAGFGDVNIFVRAVPARLVALLVVDTT